MNNLDKFWISDRIRANNEQEVVDICGYLKISNKYQINSFKDPF